MHEYVNAYLRLRKVIGANDMRELISLWGVLTIEEKRAAVARALATAN